MKRSRVILPLRKFCLNRRELTHLLHPQIELCKGLMLAFLGYAMLGKLKPNHQPVVSMMKEEYCCQRRLDQRWESRLHLQRQQYCSAENYPLYVLLKPSNLHFESLHLLGFEYARYCLDYPLFLRLWILRKQSGCPNKKCHLVRLESNLNCSIIEIQIEQRLRWLLHHSMPK